jgi:hypothetical protein
MYTWLNSNSNQELGVKRGGDEEVMVSRRKLSEN